MLFWSSLEVKSHFVACYIGKQAQTKHFIGNIHLARVPLFCLRFLSLIHQMVHLVKSWLPISKVVQAQTRTLPPLSAEYSPKNQPQFT